MPAEALAQVGARRTTDVLGRDDARFAQRSGYSFLRLRRRINVLPVRGDGEDQQSTVLKSDCRAPALGVPHTNHTWAIRHLAVSIRDVGLAGRCGSSAGALRRCGSREIPGFAWQESYGWSESVVF